MSMKTAYFYLFLAKIDLLYLLFQTKKCAILLIYGN